MLLLFFVMSRRERSLFANEIDAVKASAMTAQETYMAMFEADPLVAPGWFECFDAERIAQDLGAGRARAILAEFNEPYGFDRIVASYPDGRAYQWRQINRCGKAAFDGDPLPEGCPPRDE